MSKNDFSLDDAVKYIESHFQQESVNGYPRYLFRGEEDITWPTTRSSYSRCAEKLAAFKDEFSHWIAGHGLSPGHHHSSSLYFFLREALWNIPCLDSTEESFRYSTQIAAIMQHYGFPSSFIDFTSDIHVAAHFAIGAGVVGKVGQIMVLPTAKLEGAVFDLSVFAGARPNRQQGFALLLPPDLDLKSPDVQSKYRCTWIPFQLQGTDIVKFSNPTLLSLQDDNIALTITEWYDSLIKSNPEVSPPLASFLSSRVNTLVYTQRNLCLKTP